MTHAATAVSHAKAADIPQCGVAILGAWLAGDVMALNGT
jgi:hypothetical protein